MSDAALTRVFEKVSQTALAEKLNISQAAVSQWDRVPPLRVLRVEEITGIPRHELRPDIYPPPSTAALQTGAAA